MANSGISGPANQGPLNPANNLYPVVDTSFVSNYDYSLVSMQGMVTFGNTAYNYSRNGPHFLKVRRSRGGLLKIPTRSTRRIPGK